MNVQELGLLNSIKALKEATKMKDLCKAELDKCTDTGEKLRVLTNGYEMLAESEAIKEFEALELFWLSLTDWEQLDEPSKAKFRKAAGV